MSVSAYAKFYTFDEDGKFKSKTKDVYINFIKSCYSMNEFNEEISEVKVPAIKNLTDDPRYDFVGVVKTDSEIEKSRYFIKEENDIIIVNTLFDKSNYQDYFVDKKEDDNLTSNEKVVYIHSDQYNGMWIDEESLARASSLYEAQLKEQYKILYKLEEVEYSVKYGDKESCAERWMNDYDICKDTIDVLTYKIRAVNNLIGMFNYFEDIVENYQDRIYAWIYLC